MSQSPEDASKSLAFNGYHRKQTAEPDWFLCQVGRRTPGGEYLRRFWHPLAYVDELGDVPLRVRALGEDLIAFRDKSSRIGVLHLHCSHRNASLEFGVIEGRGLRCCYHGRLFDVDGTILEIRASRRSSACAARQAKAPIRRMSSAAFSSSTWGRRKICRSSRFTTALACRA